MLVGLAGAEKVDLELDGDEAQRVEATPEGLQDLEVGAVDVDLEVVEIGPAALGQQVGNDDGLAGIGKARQLQALWRSFSSVEASLSRPSRISRVRMKLSRSRTFMIRGDAHPAE